MPGKSARESVADEVGIILDRHEAPRFHAEASWSRASGVHRKAISHQKTVNVVELQNCAAWIAGGKPKKIAPDHRVPRVEAE